jgi:FAD/FMN-containing dehydrogenase
MTALRSDYLSWGRAHRYAHHAFSPGFIDDARSALATAVANGESVLPYGLGRSYGDCCLNQGQALLDTHALDRFIAFDPATGELECESGVSLADILALLVSRPADEPRWFLPVTPGTKFVTVGGAVANDVHGKNHHSAGCFGNHVRSLRLLRSDGIARDCSPEVNTELFRATVGGLGLTGLILSARLALAQVPGYGLESEDIRYDDLDAFFRLSDESQSDWQYTVAWVDCLARGRRLGRGVFSRARHCATLPSRARAHSRFAWEPRFAMPTDAPGFMLNRKLVRAFNAVRWQRFSRQPDRQLRAFDPVLYPLDAIGHWNRLYGPRGLFQYQCVVPNAVARDAIRTLLERIAESGHSAFLAVLKIFGDVPSPGLLSFPLPGATLALDLPNRGRETLALMDDLDGIVAESGGRLYPAKDGRMSGADFRRGFPQWKEFSGHVDPAFSSSFWRRVSVDSGADAARIA